MFSSNSIFQGAARESLFQTKTLRHHPDFRKTEGWKAAHKEKEIGIEKYKQARREA